MNNSSENAGKPAQTASDAAALVQNAAGAAAPSQSMVGRVGAAASAAQIGTRLLPAGWRMLRRYPLAAGLAIAGLVCLAYFVRPTRQSARV